MNRVTAQCLVLAGACLPLLAIASSHREAPMIAGLPRVDGTDFYMFRSYEAGRSNYVTILANYIPFQDPQGGPNFYNLDDNAVYDININNDGSGQANMTFEFRFTTVMKGLAVQAGGESTAVPLINVGPVSPADANVNVLQTYTVTLVRNGDSAAGQALQNIGSGLYAFNRPLDNIGHKSIPNYPEYAAQFIQEIALPGCGSPGRVFVGQRKEGFFIDVGELFDLVNLNPLGPRDAKKNDLSMKNITTIALELPISCVTSNSDPVIGGWTTASVKHTDDANYRQVSRLGMPLVNEVVIGLPDKDTFNASSPAQDAQFLHYVTNPSLPVLLNALFGSAAMVPSTPRDDLVTVFLTGVKGLNQPMHVTPSEMLRLNTSIAPTQPAQQKDLGVLGGDLAGFPNGRRPYDDVVDITLRVAEGALCGKAGNCGSETSDPNHGAPYTDGVEAAGPDAANEHRGGQINPNDTYLSTFPYLNNPLPGSPQGALQ